jgi:hypothetical protein
MLPELHTGRLQDVSNADVDLLLAWHPPGRLQKVSDGDAGLPSSWAAPVTSEETEKRALLRFLDDQRV